MSTKQTKKRRKAPASKDSIVKKPKVVASDSRFRKKPQYKSFRLHKRIKHPAPALPSWLEIGRKAVKLMLANSRPLMWFLLVYGLLSVIFVSGVVSPINIAEIKAKLSEQTGGDVNFSGNVTILGLLLSSSLRASGEVSALYQMIFFVSSMLALIWLYRQQQAGNRVSMRDAYYRGMYPIVPFLIICLVIGLQIIPAGMGNYLYGAVTRGGLAITFMEQLFWFLFFAMTILLSLYFVSMTIVALFVVTLPEMTPTAAIKEARSMVAHRRFSVLAKVVALIILMALIYVAIVFPAIFISATLAQILFFFLTILAVPFAVAYLFVLYRELL